MNLTAIALVVIAPLPYWILGLPWVMGSPRSRLAPLVGCTLAGVYAEWAMITGLPVRAVTVVALSVSAAYVLYRRSVARDVVNDIVEWLPFYFVSMLAASLSPFPVLGDWSGDWLILYRMGESVLGGDLPSNMLTRPPLFGAATAPLWIVADGLIPYQIMAAVASAASVTATLHFVRLLRPGA